MSEMRYDPDIRQGKPGMYDQRFERFEVEFAVPVFVTPQQQERLSSLVSDISKAPANVPVNGVHWLCGIGHKPRWSRKDAAFLGRPVDPSAPEEGAPTYDETTLHLETTARERFPDEAEQRTATPSVTPNLDYIRGEVSKLKALLDNPQPSLGTWARAYQEQMETITRWWLEAD